MFADNVFALGQSALPAHLLAQVPLDHTTFRDYYQPFWSNGAGRHSP